MREQRALAQHVRALAAGAVRVLFLSRDRTLLHTRAEPRPAPPVGGWRESALLAELFSTAGGWRKRRATPALPTGSLSPTLNKNAPEIHIKRRTPTTTHARAVQHSCGTRLVPEACVNSACSHSTCAFSLQVWCMYSFCRGDRTLLHTPANPVQPLNTPRFCSPWRSQRAWAALDPQARLPHHSSNWRSVDCHTWQWPSTSPSAHWSQRCALGTHMSYTRYCTTTDNSVFDESLTLVTHLLTSSNWQSPAPCTSHPVPFNPRSPCFPVYYSDNLFPRCPLQETVRPNFETTHTTTWISPIIDDPATPEHRWNSGAAGCWAKRSTVVVRRVSSAFCTPAIPWSRPALVFAKNCLSSTRMVSNYNCLFDKAPNSDRSADISTSRMAEPESQAWMRASQCRLRDPPSLRWPSTSLHRSMLCGWPRTKPPQTTTQFREQTLQPSKMEPRQSNKPFTLIAEMREASRTNAGECSYRTAAFNSSATAFTEASWSEATWKQLLLMASCDASTTAKVFSASERTSLPTSSWIPPRPPSPSPKACWTVQAVSHKTAWATRLVLGKTLLACGPNAGTPASLTPLHLSRIETPLTSPEGAAMEAPRTDVTAELFLGWPAPLGQCKTPPNYPCTFGRRRSSSEFATFSATVITSWKLFETTLTRSFQSDPHSNIDISLVEFEKQIGPLWTAMTLSTRNGAPMSRWKAKKHNLALTRMVQIRSFKMVFQAWAVTENHTLWHHENRMCPRWPHTTYDILLVKLKEQIRTLPTCIHTNLCKGAPVPVTPRW